MSRMFKSITKTWTPVSGCYHGCTYCWARDLAETRLKNSPRYRDGFIPKLIEKELSKRFKPGEFVFVCPMGDLFGEWVPREWIERVFARIEDFKDTWFLLQTKNPQRFKELTFCLPVNIYLGTTIETNRDYSLTKAPSPYMRYVGIRDARSIAGRKFISIEPIMDFDLNELVSWMEEIKPAIIEVGYDNYNCHLDEPELAKTEELITYLSKFTQVMRKTIRKAWNE